MRCGLHSPSMPAPQVVSVNGVVIARDVIAREVQNHPADKPIRSWQAAAQALAVRELLLQEAYALGIAANPQTDAEGRRETDEEALIRALITQEVVTPKPDDDACRRYYEQNRRRFRSPPLCEVSHILFAACQGDDPAFGRAERDAAATLALLAREPARFEELARSHSACPSAAQGGNLGQISRGQTTPEFEAALEAIEPGGICNAPVTTRYGVHIIKLHRRIEGRQQPYELVAGRIADYLRASVTNRAIAQFVARLVSRAEITGVTLAGAAAHQVN